MYTFLLHAHSGLRWLVLLILIITFAKSLMGWLGKQEFTNTDDKLSLFSLIGAHLQLVLGLALYFVSPLVQFRGEAMKDPILRQWTVEHITLMIVAIVLVTLGRSLSKRAETGKFRRIAIFFGLALVLIFAAIPVDRWF